MKIKVENVSIDLGSPLAKIRLSDQDIQLSQLASDEIRNKVGAALMTERLPELKLEITGREGVGGNNGPEMLALWAQRQKQFDQTQCCVYGDGDPAVEGFKLCKRHLRRVRLGQKNKVK